MNATEIILARAEMDLRDKLNLSPNEAERAALIVARSLGSAGWLRDPDAPPAPGEAAAPVQGTVGRGLMTELYGICAGMSRQEWEDPELASIRLAAELARLGWVHSSQATGGGLSGEAKETLILALDALENDAFRRCSRHDISIDARDTIHHSVRAARVVLAALPVRGDGPGI